MPRHRAALRRWSQCPEPSTHLEIIQTLPAINHVSTYPAIAPLSSQPHALLDRVRKRTYARQGVSPSRAPWARHASAQRRITEHPDRTILIDARRWRLVPDGVSDRVDRVQPMQRSTDEPWSFALSGGGGNQ